MISTELSGCEVIEDKMIGRHASQLFPQIALAPLSKSLATPKLSSLSPCETNSTVRTLCKLQFLLKKSHIFVTI